MTNPGTDQATRPSNQLHWWLSPLWLLAVALLFSAPGCGSCQKAQPAPKKPEEKPAPPKPDYDIIRISTKPNNLVRVETPAKAGHWVSGSLELIANNFDYRGEIATGGFALEDVPYTLATSRPVTLAKAQKRVIDVTWFVPQQLRSAGLNVQLRGADGGRLATETRFPLQMMPARQYHMVVLAREPDQYRYIRGMTSIDPTPEDSLDSNSASNYRVAIPAVKRAVPLPNQVLAWTSIAYLVWDDFDHTLITPEQQQAMVDWLHWGGQLIISGPASLDALKGSFLAPYLPATTTGTREITDDDFAKLNETWSTRTPALVVRKPWSGETLEPAPGAIPLVLDAAQAPLVVDGLVGKGRVTVTAFSLSQRELLGWPGFDGFFNGCLLRREPREFTEGPDGVTRAQWHDFNSVKYSLDAARNTRVRFFSRDTSVDPLPERSAADDQQNAFVLTDEPLLEMGVDMGPGVAGWNDHNAVAYAARDSLRNAAGIDIPDRRFVLTMLAIYLAAVVPVNWVVFRLMGRLEWAWLFTPVAAIAFAVIVTRLARLDIGFARATAEVAVIELEPNYDRGHVTRYHSLYTSLSMRYQVTSPNLTTLVEPFAVSPELLVGQVQEPLAYRTADGMMLDGYSVPSNALGMLHSEQMLDFDGSLTLDAAGLEVHNGTLLNLEDAAVFGPAGIAWIGPLKSGAKAALKFAALGDSEAAAWRAAREAAPQTSSTQRLGSLSAGGLMEVAETSLKEGEMRLVAWNQQPLAGLKIEPAAAQSRSVNVVVAHLRSPRLSEPKPDINTKAKPREGPTSPVEAN